MSLAKQLKLPIIYIAGGLVLGALTAFLVRLMVRLGANYWSQGFKSAAIQTYVFNGGGLAVMAFVSVFLLIYGIGEFVRICRNRGSNG